MYNNKHCDLLNNSFGKQGKNVDDQLYWWPFWLSNRVGYWVLLPKRESVLPSILLVIR